MTIYQIVGGLIFALPLGVLAYGCHRDEYLRDAVVAFSVAIVLGLTSLAAMIIGLGLLSGELP